MATSYVLLPFFTVHQEAALFLSKLPEHTTTQKHPCNEIYHVLPNHTLVFRTLLVGKPQLFIKNKQENWRNIIVIKIFNYQKLFVALSLSYFSI